MSFTITHRDGSMDRDPPPLALDALLLELDAAEDDEHPDVAVQHESGWSLSAFSSGLVVWENVEEETEERRVTGATRLDVRRLFDAVASGDAASVVASLDDIEGRRSS